MTAALARRAPWQPGTRTGAMAGVDPALCPPPYNPAPQVDDCGSNGVLAPYLCANCRIFVQPIDSTVGVPGSAAGSPATPIAINPQRPFIGSFLSVPPSIAPFFLITNFLVGADAQLVSIGPALSAELLEPDAVANVLNLDRIAPGVTVTFVLQNVAVNALRFLAGIFGVVVK